MQALKKAINSGDEERLKALLTNILFDEPDPAGFAGCFSK
jgi:hypothetical protein